jgi:hypothetical protein
VPDSIVPDGPGGPRRNAPASARAPSVSLAYRQR